PEPDESADTRRARRHHRRRRRTRRGLFVAGAVVGAFAVAGSALALTGIVEIGRDAPSAGAGGPASGTTTTMSPAEVRAAAAARPCRSPLDPFDPLRLWIGGDSLAGSLGPSLGRMAADTGIVQPVFFSKVSSGLSTPDFWDWPEHGTEEMFKLDPEVTVFIIGANDTMIVTDDTAEWRPAYEQAVEEMMQIMIGESRTVYWVGSPILEDDDDLAVARLNQVFQDVAARHSEVVYVDAYGLFSTPDGRYTPFVTDGEGETLRVRADDGVHFTPEGGDHLAEAIMAQLQPQCSLLAQAVPDAAKDVIETEGSSRIPGTSREDSTVTTSAPTTVATTSPPATDPPATTTTTVAPTTTTLLPSTTPTVPGDQGTG
ncbi:MAG TPA: DUF459 domain-containing protein, partial [Acidimicrobiia bacterium]